MGRGTFHSSRRAALAELVKLTREAGAPLPTNEIPSALYNVLLHHFGGIQRARRAANLPDPPQSRFWTEAEVIAELRRLHADGHTIRFRDLERLGREDLVGAIRVCVGSIVRARRLARIPDPARAEFETESWDEDRVIADILDLHERGQPLAYSKAPRALVGAGTRYFDTWAEAIAAAGLDYDDIRLRRKPYDDDAMLARIRELARVAPEMTFGQLYGHADGQAIMRRFSSIEEAVDAAGVTGWPIRVVHDAYTKDEVIRALEERHRQRKPLTKTAIATDDARLLVGIQRHYRRMEAALIAAGLDQYITESVRRGGAQPFGRTLQRWSRETAIAELRRLGNKHGALKSTHVPGGLLGACTRLFGSWENTLEQAGVTGLDHHPRGYWTRERVIEILRARAENGELLTANALGRSLASAIHRHFDGLEDALTTARVRR